MRQGFEFLRGCNRLEAFGLATVVVGVAEFSILWADQPTQPWGLGVGACVWLVQWMLLCSRWRRQAARLAVINAELIAENHALLSRFN